MLCIRYIAVIGNLIMSVSSPSDPDQYERAVREQEKRAYGIIQGMSAGLCKGLIRYAIIALISILFSLACSEHRVYACIAC